MKAPNPTPIYTIDAFTDRPFAGNPAAVCLPAADPSTDWMQQVAAEMNLAETAFLLPRGNDWSLRWFTPAVEVNLCGHATLAAAHCLWNECGVETPQLRFHTRSGVLTAERGSDGIRLDFPADPPSPCAVPTGLAEALGVMPIQVARGREDLLVELAGEAAVRALKPEMPLLARIEARGITVTARAADGRHDFVSRFFAPRCGIPEDPVTGSAHCCLGPYWSPRLGKDRLLGFQASSRGGSVGVALAGERIHLFGQAITTLRGNLCA